VRTNCIGTKHILRFAQRESFQLITFLHRRSTGTRLERFRSISFRAPLNDYAMTKWVNESKCGTRGCMAPRLSS